MPAYAQITLGIARQQLAQLLDDPANIFWTVAELNNYINEALRTWGAHTGYWRERVTLNLQAGVPFYDLTAAGTITASPTSQLPPPLALNMTDSVVFTDMQYALLEPPDATTWTGTTQFTYADLLTALQRRRDQFLIDTGILLDQTTIPGYYADGIVPLPGSVGTTLDLHRVAWTDENGYTRPLWREDAWSMMNYDQAYLTEPARPETYSFYNTESLTMQIAPPPLANGQINLLSTVSGAILNPAVGIPLGIPDNLTWAIKWGALADLLSGDGEVRDPARAGYCESRYQEGVDLARAYTNSCILNVMVASITTQTQAMENYDTYDRDWQNKPSTNQHSILTASYNLIGVVDVPLSSYQIVMDVIRNAPIPQADTDFLQLTAADYSTVLEYARHLASFKMGGLEFSITMPARDSLISQAAEYVARQKSTTRFYGVMNDLSRDDWMTRERERMQPVPKGGK